MNDNNRRLGGLFLMIAVCMAAAVLLYTVYGYLS